MAVLAVTSVVHALGSALWQAIPGTTYFLLLVAFLIGLGVRAVKGIRANPTSARSKDSDARRTRLAVRRRAENVPLGINPPELAEDPDPPIAGSSD
jgi:hypothetical protein